MSEEVVRSSVVAEETQQAVGKKHPLLELALFNESCEEAIAHWGDKNTMSHRLGTLQTVLTNKYVGKESVLFLMELADGWRSSSNFRIFDESFGEERAKNRCKVAEKAFDVLCARFFGQEKDRDPMWWWMLGDQEVFEKTLWFLRTNNDRLCRCTLRNFHADSEKPQTRTIGKFLTIFAELGWEYGRYDFRGLYQDEVVERLISARPKLVDILSATNSLHWLLRQKKLDRATRQALKSLTFRYKLYLPRIDGSWGEEYHVPKTLQEALYGGSREAEVLLLYKSLQIQRRLFATTRREVVRAEREKERQVKLKQLEEQRRQLDEQESQLLGK
ncbi:MAG: hypothetical protein A2360_03270 [Candidatus Staskawiczbacteria bacterium RIFOXYB1_FULL_32_11]|uniref:Uncharacterized protein n=1 Tax=Candidatus Staskawiczbacteria bacterium RIFOXYD1_FULL_32_13 TaxID=1802234 RepID=A0A1G2JSC5_9BACT|nr:MAG: hypothetical protein UR22_C0019G0009 [Parcubacteria group bacterium GW2011_GWC2_32_10]OGZ79768.1 MAG: hypothetical protein A2256_03375 [Candidatus Staskawiczbacteria bacterium RIFOXYA2_FULL_32_7]OGZ80540.1 MAG: hypothetical protein A2360_03270 [Candidatus Staskawiczbacteria bacterium RIFOXYB1_FULL_32_11]OGZ89180.1 MAG: hypothetical protein A2561_01170 [Candidatus Staskawiczbacteria bacterium RIFOXYD1_FULL_32_13]